MLYALRLCFHLSIHLTLRLGIHLTLILSNSRAEIVSSIGGHGVKNTDSTGNGAERI